MAQPACFRQCSHLAAETPWRRRQRQRQRQRQQRRRSVRQSVSPSVRPVRPSGWPSVVGATSASPLVRPRGRRRSPRRGGRLSADGWAARTATGAGRGGSKTGALPLTLSDVCFPSAPAAWCSTAARGAPYSPRDAPAPIAELEAAAQRGHTHDDQQLFRRDSLGAAPAQHHFLVKKLRDVSSKPFPVSSFNHAHRGRSPRARRLGDGVHAARDPQGRRRPSCCQAHLDQVRIRAPGLSDRSAPPPPPTPTQTLMAMT